MDSENGNKNFGDLDFHFPRLWSFGEISNSARRKNSNSKFKIHCLGQVTYFYFGDYLEFRGAPSASASGISAMATRA
jgi:hypothetical protein